MAGSRDEGESGRRATALIALRASAVLREPSFSSSLPVAGWAVARARALWNAVSTRWYVLAIVRQQEAFNIAALSLIEEATRSEVATPDELAAARRDLAALHERLAELDREVTALRREVAELRGEPTTGEGSAPPQPGDA